MRVEIKFKLQNSFVIMSDLLRFFESKLVRIVHSLSNTKNALSIICCVEIHNKYLPHFLTVPLL